MAKYTVQHIGYPTTSAISESAWKTYSTHETESAAWKAIDKATAHLQYGQWDDHYRVIAPDGSKCNRGEYNAEQEMKAMKKEWDKKHAK